MITTFSNIASLLGASFEGPDRPVRGINDPLLADVDELVFIMDYRFLKKAEALRSLVWIVAHPLVSSDLTERLNARQVTYMITTRPREDFVKLINHFRPTQLPTGIHPTALISGSAKMADGTTIGPHVIIGDDCEIGAHTVILAHATVGRRVKIGSDSTVHPNVTIGDDVHIGQRVTIQSGTVVGSDGFGYFATAGRHEKIPHIGRVIIEDDVEIGANCCVDRGTLGETRIGRGTKIDNLVQIAHNVSIGEHGLIAAQTGIAGSTIIGNGVTIAGQVGIVGHITIGNNVTIGAQSGVIGSIEDGKTVSGYPAREHAHAMRREAYIDRIPDILDHLKKNGKI